jgi:hypothetical protein
MKFGELPLTHRSHNVNLLYFQTAYTISLTQTPESYKNCEKATSNR